MDRRRFLHTLSRLLGLAALPAHAAPIRRHLIQQCQIAGFQYHEGEALWPYLTVGDSLQLVREPANPHDANAIRIDWNGREIGYIPRVQNLATAHLLDQDRWLEARIGGLEKHANPWRRVAIEVWLVG